MGWDQISAEELRIAAKVARASGGPMMCGAAAAWELRADLVEASHERITEWFGA